LQAENFDEVREASKRKNKNFKNILLIKKEKTILFRIKSMY